MTEGAGNAILVEITKRVIPPAIDVTVRQFLYLFCYKSNINKLEERVEELKSIREDAKSYLDSSADNNEEISCTSTAWLDKVKSAESAANGIKEATEKPKAGCVSKWCPNPKQRYLLSRKAVKKAEEIRQLKIEGKAYVLLSKPAPPPSKLTGALANDGSKDFKTRSKIMDDIMDALKDDKISIIGVCGSGGVGKTTLMHELRERAKVNGLFHEVAMATVSQNPDLAHIRGKLAEMLGLTRVKDKENEIAAADEIHKRLTGKGRRILVILDDIWDEINLEELGIPVEINQTECKVVLTSRQKDKCVRMKAQKTILVEIMPPEEAWYLFRKTAGDCVESDALNEIAKKVAGECGGLPVALVTLAKALSNKDIKIWKDAYSQLREHSVTRIPDMDKKVYSSIKMSFDFLASEQPEAMPLLLLCCQHPEDAAIKVENLARYCLALRLFKNVETLEGVRNVVCSLIEHLQSCFLLEAINTGDDFDSYVMVKVHDIIRDVGLKEERDRVSMQIVNQSKDDVSKLGTSEASDYPNLKILVLFRVDGGLLNKSFLSQMEELRVLEYSPMNRDVQLPAIEGLTNLRMLSLEYAAIDKDTISKIGRLTQLEILIFSDCFKSSPFPRQIGQLSNLKLLDLRCTYAESHPIPSGIIPDLHKLEELYLGVYYFPETPEDDEECVEEESHGHIAELEKLSNLKVLQINLLNPSELLDLNLCFNKLQKFHFGTVEETSLFSEFGRTLILSEVSIEWISYDKIESLVTRTEQLQLREIDDWTDPQKIEKFVSLRELELFHCEHLEYLISDVGGNSSSVFRKLKTLELVAMSGLTELCHKGNLPVGSLGKLTKLKLLSLPNIRHLWVGPADPLCLVNLKDICICDCGALECIIPHSAAKCLVQLEKLWVEACGMVEAIVSKGEGNATRSGGEIIEEPTDLILHFPKLIELIIYSLPNLRGIYNLDGVNGGDSSVQTLFSPLVMLPSLEELQVEGLHQLKQIVRCGTINIPNFTASDWLQNLEVITVLSCASLESVFNFEGIQFMPENAHVVTLDKLQSIFLKELPNLTCIFCSRIQDISIPQLQDIDVRDCGKLENLVPSNFIKLLEKLKRVKLVTCISIEAVFDFEAFEATREDECGILLGELQDIELENLPKLEHICRLTPREIHVFRNLRKLSMDNCGSLTYLLSSSLARMLEKLESLNISNCKSIKEGVTMNEEFVEEKIVFQSLITISLENLKKLSSFCSSERLEFEFPSLEKVSIIRCPEIKMFCYGHLTAKKLRGVEFDYNGKVDWKSDFNQTVQYLNASFIKEDDSATATAATSDDDDGDESSCSDNEGTLPELNTEEVPPNASPQTTAYSTSSPEALEDAQEIGLTTLTERPLYSSDHAFMKTKTEEELTDPSFCPDDYKSSRTLVQGVYVKSNMRLTFEEILTENPNFLSGFHVKTPMVKTALVETAIHCSQILGQGGLSSEKLVYLRNSLDDLAASGLDVAWLERGYQRAMIVLDEEKVVSEEAELARLESEMREDDVKVREKLEEFHMAKEKLESSTALRDAFKAKFEALKQGLEERKKLFGSVTASYSKQM